MVSVREICDGEAGFWINLLLFPFVLLWNSLDIYVFSCFGVLFARAYRCLCGPLLKMCCWTYTDTSFEGDAALGLALVRRLERLDLLEQRAARARRRGRRGRVGPRRGRDRARAPALPLEPI